MSYEERTTELSREELIAENVSLHHQLEWFKKQIFGEKSEKRIVPDRKQLALGEILKDEAVVEDKTITIKGHTRKKNNKKGLEGSPEDTGLRFDESQVPIETVILDNPEMKDLKEGEYERLPDKVTYKLAQHPSSVYVIKYVLPVIKVKESQKVVNTPAPQAVLEKSYADVSLLVCILLDKFLYHIPLYRQHQRLKSSGVVISRATLTNYVLRVADLLKQIALAQMRSILLSHLLSIDETPIKSGRKEKGKMRQCYFWPMYGDKEEISFVFTKNRSSDWLKKELKEVGFSGTLMADGYAGYTKVRRKLKNSFTLAQCWAHTRRKFVEAEKVEPDLVEEALKQTAEFYKYEKLIRESGLEKEEKLKYRVENIKEPVETFFLWLRKQQKETCLLPSNKFSKAVSYALKRENELKVFLSDPDVPIDNNHTERAVRPIALGRNYANCHIM